MKTSDFNPCFFIINFDPGSRKNRREEETKKIKMKLRFWIRADEEELVWEHNSVRVVKSSFKRGTTISIKWRTLQLEWFRSDKWISISSHSASDHPHVCMLNAMGIHMRTAPRWSVRTYWHRIPMVPNWRIHIRRSYIWLRGAMAFGWVIIAWPGSAG